MKGTDELSEEDIITFIRGQSTFLANHRFYTEEARGLFTHKQENIEFAQTQLESLKS